MKRWIVISLVGLAVLVLISPGIVGRLAERNIEAGLAVAELESPEITISTERFERGWFTTVGRHRIELSDRIAFPQAARFADESGYPGMPALIIDSRLDHGLLPVSSMVGDDGSLVPGLGTVRSTLQLDPGNGELIELPATIRSTIGLAGTTYGELDIEPGEWADQANQLQWQQVAATFELDSRGDLILAEGVIEPMIIATADGEVEIGEVRFDVNRSRGPYGLVNGDIDLVTGSVTATDVSGKQSGYQSLSLLASNDADGGAIAGSLRFDLTDIVAPAVGNMSMSLHLNYAGLDADAIARLYAAYEERALVASPHAALMSLYPGMESELQQLLTGGGSITFEKMNISVPTGEIVSDLMVELPEGGVDDDFSWPGLLLNTKAALNLTLPIDMFEAIAAAQPEAQSALAAGFLVADGDNYKMQIEYAQGLATVNGLPMPIPLPTP